MYQGDRVLAMLIPILTTSSHLAIELGRRTEHVNTVARVWMVLICLIRRGTWHPGLLEDRTFVLGKATLYYAEDAPRGGRRRVGLGGHREENRARAGQSHGACTVGGVALRSVQPRSTSKPLFHASEVRTLRILSGI